MIVAWALMGSARAGMAVGATVGPAVPLGVGVPGMQYSGYLGDRESIGLLHLQPELTLRWNQVTDVGAVGAGGAVSLSLGPVAVGPYGHVALAYGEAIGPAGDVGLLGEVTLLKPLMLGARVGWQRDGLQDRDPALLATAEIGLAF